jgi:hypothetical protein
MNNRIAVLVVFVFCSYAQPALGQQLGFTQTVEPPSLRYQLPQILNEPTFPSPRAIGSPVFDVNQFGSSLSPAPVFRPSFVQSQPLQYAGATESGTILSLPNRQIVMRPTFQISADTSLVVGKPVPFGNSIPYSFQNDGIPTLEQRREIRQMPIESRPNRPMHFYGNTVRRRGGW